MHLGLSRCLLSRTLTTVAKQQSIDKQAVIQKTLAAYPIFNLNDDAGRHLGPQKGDEAILTLSGGVDSSVSAYLALERRGLIPHKTIFMRNWNSLEESESFEPGSGGAQGCQWQRDWDRVSAMAKWLGVKAELVRQCSIADSSIPLS
jgi:asparagine synthetase B (glutamine-hydrolysing)